LKSTVLPQAETKGTFSWPPLEAALSILSLRLFVKNSVLANEVIKAKETAINAGL
jgi:hypothetical protein